MRVTFYLKQSTQRQEFCCNYSTHTLDVIGPVNWMLHLNFFSNLILSILGVSSMSNWWKWTVHPSFMSSATAVIPRSELRAVRYTSPYMINQHLVHWRRFDLAIVPKIPNFSPFELYGVSHWFVDLVFVDFYFVFLPHSVCQAFSTKFP